VLVNGQTVVGAIIVLALWAIISALSLVDTLFLATPWDTGTSLAQLFVSGRLLTDLGHTVGRALLGFSLSAIIGVPLGLLLGWSKRFHDWVNVPVEFLRSLPAPVLYPLFIILFGIGDHAKVAGVVFACLFPIIVQTAYGVVNGNCARIRLAERMGFNQWQVLLKIIYPQALPYVFVGLRNALSLSLIATVVVEMMMAGRTGLGYSIFNAYQIFRIPEMYAYIIVTGLTGWALNKLFVAFERRQLYWVRR
jgi:ABC-type nitrate/sulfonate/bicarbonate transport system permease component